MKKISAISRASLAEHAGHIYHIAGRRSLSYCISTNSCVVGHGARRDEQAAGAGWKLRNNADEHNFGAGQIVLALPLLEQAKLERGEFAEWPWQRPTGELVREEVSGRLVSLELPISLTP